MSTETAYSIGGMDEVSALAGTDMLEIERPEAVAPNSWWRTSVAAISNYVLGKIAAGSGISVNLVAGQLTIGATPYVGAPIVTISSTATTLTPAHAAKFLACSNAAAQVLTISPQADQEWPDNAQIEVCQLGAGLVSVAGGTGVVITKHADIGTVSGGQYAVFGLKRITVNQWMLFGKLGAP